ncbi:hypothetical protein [Sansalvadorimonas verongulae]|uniref:hypothetical protein n=1 Tax=Sansalvadorimonas verongulae TaxID=2172824 RepID=UPI0012BC6127|nr:hypothetical protein [Sansalvadorimonas verongulae]MTI13341.1 hypothetical protein [Sansalvadorimonas verongulae]
MAGTLYYQCPVIHSSVQATYNLPDTRQISAINTLPPGLLASASPFLEQPWASLLERSEVWTFWESETCRYLMLSSEEACYGVIVTCDNQPAVFHAGEHFASQMNAGAKPVQGFQLRVLDDREDAPGTHIFSTVQVDDVSALEGWEVTDGGFTDVERDGVASHSSEGDLSLEELKPHSWFPGEIYKNLVTGFFIGAGVETVYRGYQLLQRYRAGLQLTERDIHRAGDQVLRAGVLAAFMSGATHTLMHQSGLLKPVSSFLVGVTVRSVRNYLSQWSFSAQDMTWILLKSGVISGTSYLFSVGGARLQKKIVGQPGIIGLTGVTGGIVGDAAVNQVRYLLR